VDWTKDATAKVAAKRELGEETGTEAPEFFETLDTYDRNGRDPRQYAGEHGKDGTWIERGVRVVSKAFLAIGELPLTTPQPIPGEDAAKAHWDSVYRYLPWEDLRSAEGRKARATLRRKLLDGWANEAGQTKNRRLRVDAAFGPRRIGGRMDWNEERAGERAKLLLAAGLMAEANRDKWGDGPETTGSGVQMAFDHRQMLADALGRIRGKLKYVPAVLEAFAGAKPRTVKWLHETCEAISGRPIYLTNLQRALTKTHKVVVKTRGTAAKTGSMGGPAAALYTFGKGTGNMRLDPSIRMPWAPVEGAS
jgi:hypothetical protein